MLVLLVLGPAAAAAADPGPALSVDAAAGRHAISPYIYGWNFAPFPFAGQIDLPVDRRGGNSADTLNWQTGVENHSNDYFFENLPTQHGPSHTSIGLQGAVSIARRYLGAGGPHAGRRITVHPSRRRS